MTAFDLRRVEERRDWAEVRSLRERALLRRNDLPDEAEGFADDGHDSALNSMTFLLFRNGRAAGCTRSSVSSPGRRSPLPAIEVFHREIEISIGWEATVVESSLTFVDPDLPGDPREALLHLSKAQTLRCRVERADWLIAAVPESQIGFHRRVFDMEILSGAERCPRLAQPRVLMGLDYGRRERDLFRRLPMLAVSEEEEQEFRRSGCIELADARADARAIA